jgi:hypothetical protein
MIVILYLVLIVIFLFLLKDLFFSKKQNNIEQFHVPEEDEVYSPTTQHDHTSQEDETGTNTMSEDGGNSDVQDANDELNEDNENEEDDEDKSTTSSTSTSPGVAAHYPSQEDTAAETAAQSSEEAAEAEESTVSPVEDRRLAQEQVNSFNEENPIVTVAVDDQCCGVTIYEKKLENINKCIIQHIQNTGDRLNPDYTEWKEVDEENNDCKSPQPILARTSNCHYIVKDYSDNINSLLCLLNDSTTNCGSNSNSEETLDGGLSDQDRLAIWNGNIRCVDGTEGEPVQYHESGYFYLNCN